MSSLLTVRQNSIIYKAHTRELHFQLYLPSKDSHNVLSYPWGTCQLDEQKQHQFPCAYILLNGNQLPLSASTLDAIPTTPGISNFHQVSATFLFHVPKIHNLQCPNAEQKASEQKLSQLSSVPCFSTMYDHQFTHIKPCYKFY